MVGDPRIHGGGQRGHGSGPKRWRPRGFTLIEVLIVVTLLVVLASIGLPIYQNAVQRSREAALKENLFRMRDAIDQYYADKNKYPQSLQDLVDEKYLREIPKDPMTDSADTWQTIPAEFDPADPAAEPGIYDVKSGSDGIALDGTRYADW
jgi:general secretion pathway protein G